MYLKDVGCMDMNEPEFAHGYVQSWVLMSAVLNLNCLKRPVQADGKFTVSVAATSGFQHATIFNRIDLNFLTVKQCVSSDHAHFPCLPGPPSVRGPPCLSHSVLWI